MIDDSKDNCLYRKEIRLSKNFNTVSYTVTEKNYPASMSL
ncbi:hypothetical protein P262_02790 [Cronobacter malonaticus]|uniref:Uncharacterized protein n=1 Tax=Cronobacter malonaticus TaxID=413503 RepID=V5TYJ0_9ENTR|nr:hypothetical protein P262_02790 [Cronobacter malonaticus]